MQFAMRMLSSGISDSERHRKSIGKYIYMYTIYIICMYTYIGINAQLKMVL